MTLLEKIRLFFKLKDAEKGIREAYMKSGLKTTEFWMTTLTILGAVALAVAGYIPVDLLIKVTGGMVAVYTIARAIVKFTPSPKDDLILEKVAIIIRNLGIKLPVEEQPK